MIQNKKLYTCPFGSSRIPALISHIFAHILAYLGGVLEAIARICIRPVSLRTILLVICTFLLGCHLLIRTASIAIPTAKPTPKHMIPIIIIAAVDPISTLPSTGIDIGIGIIICKSVSIICERMFKVCITYV